MLVNVVGVDRVMFASEMLGGVTTIDPKTGQNYYIVRLEMEEKARRLIEMLRRAFDVIRSHSSNRSPSEARFFPDFSGQRRSALRRR